MTHPLPRRLLVAITALTAVATGCAVGERPTLEAADVITDPAGQAVVSRLDRPPTADFTATYTITPTATSTPTTATVTQRDGTVQTQIGEVVFTTDADGRTTTCAADGTDCEEQADDARVSDLGITHQFWSDSSRQRLATDAARRIGTSTGNTATIADRPAVCVAIKLPSSVETVGTVTYCALEQGVLARYIGADSTIELTGFTADG
jgi:hypothetical protein